jgi:hypothetical protein
MRKLHIFLNRNYPITTFSTAKYAIVDYGSLNAKTIDVQTKKKKVGELRGDIGAI